MKAAYRPFAVRGASGPNMESPPLDGYQRFLKNPKKTWEDRINPKGPMVELARALKNAVPNPGHIALVELELLNIVKSIITQNIDNLHYEAGKLECS